MHTCVCNVVDCLGNLAVNIWDLLRNFQREHNDQPVTNPAGKRMGLWEQTPIINGFKTCFVYQWLSYCSSFSIVNWVGEVTVIYLPLKKANQFLAILPAARHLTATMVFCFLGSTWKSLPKLFPRGAQIICCHPKKKKVKYHYLIWSY